jgi:hypothetical protein
MVPDSLRQEDLSAESPNQEVDCGHRAGDDQCAGLAPVGRVAAVLVTGPSGMGRRISDPATIPAQLEPLLRIAVLIEPPADGHRGDRDSGSS